MAERSFAREVQQLRVGAGAQFRGEGIPAITKALLENRVGYFANYQGGADFPPMDVLADAADILAELGVHFESCANEAAASAALATSVIYPARGAVTFNSTAGIPMLPPTGCRICPPAR
jgi:indolepyruvate ferredoxin oxidoreductase, alpha subunit